MGVVDKIEGLVFGSGALARLEILKNRQVVVHMGCMIEKLSETLCCLRTSTGVVYRIFGTDLQVKEYGDTYVNVVGSLISKVEIGQVDDK